MTNILLTNHCQRRCPSRVDLDATEDVQSCEMDMRDLITVADMIVASGDLRAGVLAGEPTPHPHCCEMVSYLLARGIRVVFFTSGIYREELMDELEKLSQESRFRFLVNVNFPEIKTGQNLLRQERFIRRFAGVCDLGLNVSRADLDPRFLSDLARRTGVRNCRIRVGLAHPIVGEANEFLSPADYREVAGSIVDLAEAVFDLGIVVSLDCGFTLCSFTDEQLGRLRRVKAETSFICRAAVGIAPGPIAWPCFPLAKHNRIRIDGNTRLKDLQDRFWNINNELRGRSRKGVFKECDDCVYFEHRVCEGGCLTHLIPDAGIA